MMTWKLFVLSLVFLDKSISDGVANVSSAGAVNGLIMLTKGAVYQGSRKTTAAEQVVTTNSTSGNETNWVSKLETASIAGTVESVTLNLENVKNAANYTQDAGRILSDNVTSMENDSVTEHTTRGSARAGGATVTYIGTTAQYPFFAAVHWFGLDLSFDQAQCSGGILSRTAVVTSCSCLYGDNWPSAPSSTYYYVTVGHRKFATINDTTKYGVHSIKFHPSCERLPGKIHWEGNIALLNIAKPGMNFSSEVQPMKLPTLKMWDASDVLGVMSQQRRHCRVIGWNAKAPMVDTAIGRLIPLDECVSPSCSKNQRCPMRNTVNGFMVEITPNEPTLLSGALLMCSNYVWAIVNTVRHCSTNNVFATCSPEELIFSNFNYELTEEENTAMLEYQGRFKTNISGWENYTYPTTTTTTSEKVKVFGKLASTGSIVFPFYASREAAYLAFTYIFSVGYYFSLSFY